MPRRMRARTLAKKCLRAHKVSFATEIDAKIALASRQAKDKGECRAYPCGRHWHLTSQPLNGD